MFETTDDKTALGLWLVPQTGLSTWLESQDEVTRNWLTDLGFGAKRHEMACLASPAGKLRGAVLKRAPV